MKPDDILFGRRIRQNHALEHATITILSGMIPDLRVSARSSSNGFIIFGDVDLGLLRRAVDEALRRFQAGGGAKGVNPQLVDDLAGRRSIGGRWGRACGGFQPTPAPGGLLPAPLLCWLFC